MGMIPGLNDLAEGAIGPFVKYTAILIAGWFVINQAQAFFNKQVDYKAESVVREQAANLNTELAKKELEYTKEQLEHAKMMEQAAMDEFERAIDELEITKKKIRDHNLSQLGKAKPGWLSKLATRESGRKFELIRKQSTVHALIPTD